MSKKQVAGYRLDKKIGRGSYATVWKGRVEAFPDEAVAVKVISRQTVTETAQLRQEVEVLRRISHDNIVRFRDLKKSAAHFYLVLEYCAGGDLSQFLREKGRVEEEVARRFLTQIAAGLCVLHRENVLHRDLKPQNILLSDSSASPVLKIADFGFARALQPQDMAATICGSPLYMAPEILRHEPYDARADLWSVGAILYELLVGRPPFTGANPMQLLANIEKHGELQFDGVQVSPEGQEFLRSLLQRDPKDRLSTKEFMEHPYVRLDQRSAATSGSAVRPPPPARSGSKASESAARASQQHSPTAGEAVLYSSDAEDALAVPSDWCLSTPKSSPTDGAPASGSAATPSSGCSFAGSPVPSPMNDTSPEASQVVDTSRHKGYPRQLSPPPPPPADPHPGQRPPGGAWAGAGGSGGSSASRIPVRQGSDDEDFVVIASQPVSAYTRGKGPTMKAAASSFCGNLSRIAETFEKLAEREQEQSPVEALALLLRALACLERALKVSLPEDGMHERLRQAYRRILEAAEAAVVPVRAQSNLLCRSESSHPPARPNALVFDFAMQLARDAGVLLSKGHETGGWEVACHEKLSLALLLLDLFSSEAEGEDIATIASYTAAIARITSVVERRIEAAQAAAGLTLPDGRPLLHASAQLAGC